MTEENYFGNIRTVGASIDQGIAKLQETWKMPHLFFCKSNETDQISARKLVENLRSELNILKVKKIYKTIKLLPTISRNIC